MLSNIGWFFQVRFPDQHVIVGWAGFPYFDHHHHPDNDDDDDDITPIIIIIIITTIIIIIIKGTESSCPVRAAVMSGVSRLRANRF